MKIDQQPSLSSKPLNEGAILMQQMRASQTQAGGVDPDSAAMVKAMYASKGTLPVSGGKRKRPSTYRRRKSRHGKTYRNKSKTSRKPTFSY